MGKIKRQDGNISCWVFFIITILFNITIVFSLGKGKFADVDLLLMGVVEFFLLGSTILFFKSREYIKTVSIQLFEFNLWDSEKATYVKRYDFVQTKLMANFLLTFRMADTLKTPSEEEIKKSIENDLEWVNSVGYHTKEECMENVLKVVKNILASRKIQNDITITDIEFKDVLDIEDLIGIVLSEENEK